MLSMGLMLAAMVGLVIAAYLGWRDHEWPAEYLQDNQWGTWLSAGPLLASGLISLHTALRSRDASRRFWVIVGITLLIIAGDDLLRFHENLELTLVSLFNLDPEHFMVARINDSVIIVYGLAAAIYTTRCRHELLRFPWACYCLGVGAFFFAGMVICDVLHISATLEESMKIVAAVLILSAMLEVNLRVSFGSKTTQQPITS